MRRDNIERLREIDGRNHIHSDEQNNKMKDLLTETEIETD